MSTVCARFLPRERWCFREKKRSPRGKKERKKSETEQRKEQEAVPFRQTIETTNRCTSTMCNQYVSAADFYRLYLSTQKKSPAFKINQTLRKITAIHLSKDYQTDDSIFEVGKKRTEIGRTKLTMRVSKNFIRDKFTTHAVLFFMLGSESRNSLFSRRSSLIEISHANKDVARVYMYKSV